DALPWSGDKAKGMLEQAVKQSVLAYWKSQLNLKRKDREEAVKTTKLRIKGKLTECVLISLLPDGHYDLDADDIVGAAFDEGIDSGANVVDAEGKCRAVADQSVGRATANAISHDAAAERGSLLGGAGLAHAVAGPRSRTADSESDGEDMGKSLDGSDASEDERDNLKFVTSCILDMDDGPAPAPKVGSARPGGSNKHASSASAGPSSTHAPDAKCSKRETKSTLPQPGPEPAGNPPAKGKHGRPGKWRNKSPREVLESEGIAKPEAAMAAMEEKYENEGTFKSLRPAKESEGIAKPEAAAAAMEEKCENEAIFKWLRPAKDSLSEVMGPLRKAPREAYAALVKLDSKVWRLVPVPEEAANAVSKLRAKTQAMVDFADAVSDTSKKNGPGKLKKAMGQMTDAGFNLPIAAFGLLAKVGATDAANFYKASELAEIFARLFDSLPGESDNVQEFVSDLATTSFTKFVED
ncbi:unnamed protein product, partial [Prorocentrum cordatum]